MPDTGSHTQATGLREIDADTEGLRWLMSRLFDPMVECRRRFGSCDRTRCTRLTALKSYVGRSFSRQEKLMASVAYPHADHHGRDHWKLMDLLTHMYEANVCADRDRSVVQAVVGRWLDDHGRHCDTTLAHWARSPNRRMHAAE